MIQIVFAKKNFLITFNIGTAYIHLMVSSSWYKKLIVDGAVWKDFKVLPIS